MVAYTELTLAELVAECPRRAAVFEDLGLDYCCHGRRTLAEACAEKQIEPAALFQRLEAADGREPASDDVNWSLAPLAELIEHIVDVHHAYLRRELPRLAGLLSRVLTAHGVQHPELFEVEHVLRGLDEELTAHMRKEEQVLFPWIGMLVEAGSRVHACCGSLSNPIQVMEHEHRDAADALARLRFLTGDYRPPADACSTYRTLLAGLADLERDLHRHVHEENNILFPRATALERFDNATPGDQESTND
jgi:regulator of cell morphogenesis and NO signaling